MIKSIRPRNKKDLATLNVHLVTWNVATQFPDADLNLCSVLNNSRPDILLFGLQEVKSQPQNILADNFLAGEDPWTSSMRQSLASQGYIKIKTIRLLGVVLSLFTLSKHAAHFRGVETQYTRLGLGGYWGNKGCVSIRWQVYGVSMVVVNTHLAAHGHMNQERLASYNSLLGSHVYNNKDTEMILYHDYVFWMGDLNFRLEVDPQDLSSEQIAQQVSKQQFSKLLALDQLSLARSNGDAFSELNETLPNFPPTYKYRIGTSEYDLKRAPAWTDRILFKANVANYDTYKLSLNQHSYSALQQFSQSDHKPVCSNFSVSVFSSKIANDLLLPCFNPIVKFIDAGPYYVNEDLLIIYTVNIENRRFMNNWDWIGLYRANNSNLEDYITYTWASNKLVRDGAYEVIFGETVNLSPGQFRLVYFSSGGRDILGISDVISVRFREFERLDSATEAREIPSTESAVEANEREL